MRKKLVPLIAIAFVVAVLSTAVFYSLLAGRLEGKPATTAVARGKVVVAARDITAGTVLSNSDLADVAWAGATVPDGSYDSAERVVGKTAFSAMIRGEPVLASRLASKDGSTGAKIPEGMRAVSIHVSDSSGVVGMLKPGYKVDIQDFASRSDRGPKDEVRTLLRGVSVLAVNAQPEQSSQGYFSAPVITVLVGARDAEQLAQADSYARLRLTLRNPLEKTAETSVQAAPSAAVRPPPEVLYRIQAIALTDEGLAALASRLDQRLEGDRMHVVVTREPVSPASIVEWTRSGGWGRAEAEVVLAGRSRQWAAYELPGSQGAGRVRLLLALRPDGHGIRIRPEVTGRWDGRMETRTVETDLNPHGGRVILVSGLDRGEASVADAKSRHLVLVVIPAPAG